MGIRRLEGEGSTVPHARRPGDVLADRYRLVDLLVESSGARFWRAYDRVLERHVAIHVIDADDARAPALMEAARRSAMVLDPRILRVLDADLTDDACYVVNEWGWGTSLDIVVGGNGPLGPRRAAYLVAEVADSMAVAHAAGVAHGRLNPENVLIDRHGAVRIIGFCVDAALHGVTSAGGPSDVTADVTDLAGLLYCLLTTKWAGASGSQVPGAPREHGEVLRPRRVRAGVPRTLDVVCEEVLHRRMNGRGDPGTLATARGIAVTLADFVGDAGGMAEALMASTPPVLPDEEQVRLPPVPEIGLRPDQVDPPPHEPGENQAEDLPTEPGMPIFDDDSLDVSWLERRTTAAPPPPPFEEPPERPLFAPVTSRTPREGTTPPSGTRPREEFWPFASDTGRGTDTRLHQVSVDDVPGRTWLRVAVALSAVVVLALAVVVAVNLGHGKGVLGGLGGSDGEPTGRVRPEASATPLTGLTATDLDPQGTPEPRENPELAPLAVDGDPDTAWETEGYFDQLGTGFKSGVGLVIDLHGEHTVSSVDLRFIGSPTGVELYASDAAPTKVAGLDRVATGTADQSALTLDLTDPVQTRYLVVWLTSLPAEGDRFRGRIAEVGVRGD